MNLRKLLTKINNAIRPVHVKGDGQGAGGLSDAKATALGGASVTTKWGASQQDEKPK